MKLIASILTILLLITGCSEKTKNAKSKFIKDSISKYDIDKTIKIIQDDLSKKNYKLVSIYSHEKDAIKLKQMLYPTKSVEFNNNKISTKLLQCNPTLSTDLPIKIGVYNEINGKTHITFTDPEYWSLKHNIKDKDCINLLFLIKKDLLDLSQRLSK